jgi:hypothetical protein
LTFAYIIYGKKLIIEAPLEKEKNFVIFNNIILLNDITKNNSIFVRKLFETKNGKKLKCLLT